MSIEADFQEAVETNNYWGFLLTHGSDAFSVSTGEKIPQQVTANEDFKKYAAVYAGFQLAKKGKPDGLPKEGAVTEEQLVYALKNGYLDIVQYLYQKGAELYYTELSTCPDEKSRAWFLGELKKALNESYPDPRYRNRPKKKNQFFCEGEVHEYTFENKCIPALQRAIELEDHEYIKTALAKVTPIERYAALVYATRAKLLPMIKLLHEQGVGLNPTIPFTQSGLHEAIEGGDESIIDYYLSAEDIEIDTQESRKLTPLITAVDSNDINTARKLLAKGASTTLKMANGSNVLHIVVAIGNVEMLMLLIKTPDFQALVQQRNIYGQTPLDKAISEKKDDMIKGMDPTIDLEKVKKSPAYGKGLIKTRQDLLIPKITAYLTSQKRSLGFTSEGYCNGLAYLFLVYGAQNKEDYFFDTLGLMANWDEKVETLDKPFPSDLPQATYYKNLKELFEQWINDIILFQASNIETVLEMAYYDRDKQHKAIGKSDDLKPVFLYTERERYSSPPNRSADQLREVLGYLIRMPNGCRVEMSGGRHAISLYKNNEGKIKLYDPNFLSKASDTDDLNEVVQRIIDYKYIVLQKYGDKVVSLIDVFYFKKDEGQLDFDNFQVFSDDELPKSKKEAEEFLAKSPSHFTHLHVAVMTHSLPAIRKLLKDNHCDLMAVDAEGRTVLDMVFQTRCIQQDIVTLFLFSPHVQGLEKYLIDAIKKNNVERVKLFLSSPRVDPNMLDEDGRHPIDVVVETSMYSPDRIEMLKLLIPHVNQEKLIEYLFKSISEELYSMYTIFVYPALLNACKDNKAILNARNQQGLTALHVAAIEKQFPKAEKLVEAGCDVDALLSPSGNSLLISLVKLKVEEDKVQQNERYQLINTLLDHRADVNLRNARGECALDLVRDSADEELKAIFVKRNLIQSMSHGK
jgi:ankyrin repeat protein